MVALGNANGVLRIDMGVAFGDFWNDAASPQLLRVARADAPALFDFPLKMRPFGEQNGCLQSVESSVRAKPWMFVALESAVGANGSHALGQGGVGGEERAAVAVTAERICR